MKQARPRGRRPLATPRDLLRQMARLMTDKRFSRWRAACEVAGSAEGCRFGAEIYISSSKTAPSLAKRLDRDFVPQARSLLAEAAKMAASRRRLEAISSAAVGIAGAIHLAAASADLPAEAKAGLLALSQRERELAQTVEIQVRREREAMERARSVIRRFRSGIIS